MSDNALKNFYKVESKLMQKSSEIPIKRLLRTITLLLHIITLFLLIIKLFLLIIKLVPEILGYYQEYYFITTNITL